VKPINEMTKRELLAYAEAQGLVLSTATRLRRTELEQVIRRMMQRRYREQES
jgi:hypothetical protein